jgi:hypothetical protein
LVGVVELVWPVEVEVMPLPDADKAELGKLVGWLRDELSDTDIQWVDVPSQGPAPVGAKAMEVLAVGKLVVAVTRSVASLQSVVSAVRSWVGRSEVHSVKISLDGDVLEVTGVSDEDQRRLIDAWVDRHAARTA